MQGAIWVGRDRRPLHVRQSLAQLSVRQMKLENTELSKSRMKREQRTARSRENAESAITACQHSQEKP